MEKVKALKPDLVIASLTVPGMERNVEALREIKLPYIVLSPKNIEETLEDILILGTLTDTIQKAEKLVEYMTNTIDSLKSELGKNQFKPKLYWEWWPKPLIAACKLSWINDMSEIVGGINVFSHVEKESSIIEDSDIFNLDPDIICICWCGDKMQKKMSKDKIFTRNGWENIKAIKGKRVYCLPESLFGRPGPRIIDGLKLLSQIIHSSTMAHEPTDN
jgi:iron complex transport system substrate-binding protein